MLDPAADEKLIIAPADHSWQATHPTSSLAAAGELTWSGAPVWHRCTSTLGQLQDDLALVEDVRGHETKDQAAIEAKGYLPFGTQPRFMYASRYSDAILRITTDVYLPPRTQLREQATIGSLELATGWTDYRHLTMEEAGGFRFSDWAELPADGLRWSAPPLALLLRQPSGLVLEIGTGSDFWRWQRGFCGADNQANYRLHERDNHWQFDRQVSLFSDPFDPAHMEYRFNWYAAWSGQLQPAEPTTEQLVPCHWQEDGRLDLSTIDSLSERDCLVIDLASAPWPKELLRTSDQRPCLAARGVGKRLRALTRQLQAHDNQQVAICFRHLLPGACREGSHVGRPGDLLHWDMGHLLELASWMRHALGRERRIYNEIDPLRLPSLANLFLPQPIHLDDPRWLLP